MIVHIFTRMFNSAINWARAVGLKVLIDLHGAPGSQVRLSVTSHHYLI